jgi:predicted HTH transcriptional regulator
MFRLEEEERRIAKEKHEHRLHENIHHDEIDRHVTVTVTKTSHEHGHSHEKKYSHGSHHSDEKEHHVTKTIQEAAKWKFE